MSEKNVIEEAQIASLMEKLKPKKSPATVAEENIEKCEIQLQESGADIDEIFLKLYGQPSQPVSVDEQREILRKENTRRTKADRISGNTEDEKTVEECRNRKSEMVLIAEDVIEQDSVLFQQAEVDWDDLYEDFESSDNVEKQTKKTGSFFSCAVV